MRAAILPVAVVADTIGINRVFLPAIPTADSGPTMTMNLMTMIGPLTSPGLGTIGWPSISTSDTNFREKRSVSFVMVHRGTLLPVCGVDGVTSGFSWSWVGSTASYI